MSTDLTIGYIVHDGTYAVVEDRTFVARCSNRQQAERVRAALSAADELAALRHELAVERAERQQAQAWWLHLSHKGHPHEGDYPEPPPIDWDALAAASPTTADHPYSLSLPEGASIHVPCCDLPQSRHPSLGEPFSPTTADDIEALPHRPMPDAKRITPRAQRTARDLVDLIHEHGSDELIAMAEQVVDAPAHDGRTVSDALGGGK